MEPPNTMPGAARSLKRSEAPRLDREFFDHREQPAAFGTDPRDGLPRPISEATSDSTYVVPLSPATFICMGDHSAFTLPGQPDVRFEPSEVQTIAGDFFVGFDLAVERANGETSRVTFVAKPGPTHGFVQVEPLRRQCNHYVRQLTDTDNRPRGFMARFCTALRDESGEYQSLRDTALYACELRDPRDRESERALNEFDAKKIAEGRERSAQPEFDVDAALHAQAPERQVIASSEDPFPDQLYGQWDGGEPIDAPSPLALLLAPGGAVAALGWFALSIIQVESPGGWCVLSEAGAQTYLHSRNWLRGPCRFGWDRNLGIEWVEVDATFVGRSSDALDKWRRFKISAVKGIDREQVARMFGEHVAAAAREDQLSLLLKVQEQEQA